MRPSSPSAPLSAPGTPRTPRRKNSLTQPSYKSSPSRSKASLHDNSAPFPTSTAGKLKRKRRSSSSNSVRRMAFLEHEKRGVATGGLERGLVRQMSGLKMTSPLNGEEMEVEGVLSGSAIADEDQHREKRQEGEGGLEGVDGARKVEDAEEEAMEEEGSPTPDKFIFEGIPALTKDEEEELKDVDPGFFYYKPTAAQLWARSNRRSEQIREYKLREAREAREARRERRKAKEEAEAKAKGEGERPRVRFAEV